MDKNHLSPERIKKEVRHRYAELIKSANRSCCEAGPPCCSPQDQMKGSLVQLTGYTSEELKNLPEGAVENAFGCGNPLAFAGITEGQTVIDIGSGAGIDCFLAAARVGRTGRVIGIDMTPEMIEKAKANAAAGGYTNTEFRLGEAEAMPVEDSSVDWVISNCVINLSPDKPRVFREIARVLKPGGRFSISDIVLGDDLPEWLAQDIPAWTGCIAGAIKESEYIRGLQRVGLVSIEVTARMFIEKQILENLLPKPLLSEKQEQSDLLISDIHGKIWSAKIKGEKPIA
ncbi:MAG: arsenite methyltransferase [Candidatus Aminicenantales bacterium]